MQTSNDLPRLKHTWALSLGVAKPVITAQPVFVEGRAHIPPAMDMAPSTPYPNKDELEQVAATMLTVCRDARIVQVLRERGIATERMSEPGLKSLVGGVRKQLGFQRIDMWRYVGEMVVVEKKYTIREVAAILHTNYHVVCNYVSVYKKRIKQEKKGARGREV